MYAYINITGQEYVMLVNDIEIIEDLGSPEIFVHLSSVTACICGALKCEKIQTCFTQTTSVAP